ncbi:MAG: hypothetical protein H6635_05165 [Anaerolineales bacterium]|nr:hypothetical protein [Anaerolineales bacterium]MCB9144738.1 hypothetical protein [Anaerolineales bacterium]
MFDDLRNDANSQFNEDPQSDFQFGDYTSDDSAGGFDDSGYETQAPNVRARPKKFLGMTSVQRFVLVFLMMMATCVLGFLCLFATGSISF